MTALMWASENDNLEVVKLLLAVPGINVNRTDKYGVTALNEASYSGHSEVVKVLLAAPQNVLRSILSSSPLRYQGGWWCL